VTESWPDVVARYESYRSEEASLIAMLQLVKRIAKSDLAAGLHPWTSMFDLFLTQAPVSYPYEGPRLKISPTHQGQIEFRYIDTTDDSQQWHRTVAASEVVQRLLKFLDQLRWFPRESLRLDA
jgi:hypothetical protein